MQCVFLRMLTLFTCLREKTWKELTVAEVDRMACEFVETVRRALENHAGYLEASRFLEELGKRLNYWVGCQDKASMEEEQGRIFFRPWTRRRSWWRWNSS